MEFNTKKVKKLWKRSLFGDFDGDGVMNAFDCKPKNKRRQDSDEEFKEKFWKLKEDLSKEESEETKKQIKEEMWDLVRSRKVSGRLI